MVRRQVRARRFCRARRPRAGEWPTAIATAAPRPRPSPAISRRSARRSSSWGSCSRRAPTCCRSLPRCARAPAGRPRAVPVRATSNGSSRRSWAFACRRRLSSSIPTPIAAASLGQVHRAVLRGGREVAVKVQRPGIREQVLKDLDALDESRGAVRTGSAAHRGTSTRSASLQEFRRSLMSELDYREEARNLVTPRHAAARLRAHRRAAAGGRLHHGARADDGLRRRGRRSRRSARSSGRKWTARRWPTSLFRAYLQQILVDGVFHADPHPGNVLLTPDHRLALVDLGMVGPPVDRRAGAAVQADAGDLRRARRRGGHASRSRSARSARTSTRRRCGAAVVDLVAAITAPRSSSSTSGA